MRRHWLLPVVVCVALLAQVWAPFSATAQNDQFAALTAQLASLVAQRTALLQDLDQTERQIGAILTADSLGPLLTQFTHEQQLLAHLQSLLLTAEVSPQAGSSGLDRAAAPGMLLGAHLPAMDATEVVTTMQERALATSLLRLSGIRVQASAWQLSRASDLSAAEFLSATSPSPGTPALSLPAAAPAPGTGAPLVLDPGILVRPGSDLAPVATSALSATQSVDQTGPPQPASGPAAIGAFASSFAAVTQGLDQLLHQGVVTPMQLSASQRITDLDGALSELGSYILQPGHVAAMPAALTAMPYGFSGAATAAFTITTTLPSGTQVEVSGSSHPRGSAESDLSLSVLNAAGAPVPAATTPLSGTLRITADGSQAVAVAGQVTPTTAITLTLAAPVAPPTSLMTALQQQEAGLLETLDPVIAEGNTVYTALQPLYAARQSAYQSQLAAVMSHNAVLQQAWWDRMQRWEHYQLALKAWQQKRSAWLAYEAHLQAARIGSGIAAVKGGGSPKQPPAAPAQDHSSQQPGSSARRGPGLRLPISAVLQQLPAVIAARQIAPGAVRPHRSGMNAVSRAAESPDALAAVSPATVPPTATPGEPTAESDLAPVQTSTPLTGTDIFTPTHAPVPSISPTPPPTLTVTGTDSPTPRPTHTATGTDSPTPLPTYTPTRIDSPTPTATLTSLPTATPTDSPSPTDTRTPSDTPSPTDTPAPSTATPVPPTATPTPPPPSSTETPLPPSPTPTVTPSDTDTPVPPTNTPVRLPPSSTSTPQPSDTATAPPPSPTSSDTPTASPTPTAPPPSFTPTLPPPTATQTPVPPSPTRTQHPLSPTASGTAGTIEPSATLSPALSPSITASPTFTRVPPTTVHSPTATLTATASDTPASAKNLALPTSTPSDTDTVAVPSPSVTATASDTMTPTISMTPTSAPATATPSVTPPPTATPPPNPGPQPVAPPPPGLEPAYEPLPPPVALLPPWVDAPPLVTSSAISAMIANGPNASGYGNFTQAQLIAGGALDGVSSYQPPLKGVITTYWGGTTPWQSFHTGVDIATAKDTPVHAAAAGVVIYAGLAVPGDPTMSYGNCVVIMHNDHITTLYGHMDMGLKGLQVHAGEFVQAGQIIGFEGQTGWATGPHVHFEMRLNNVAFDPLLLVSASAIMD